MATINPSQDYDFISTLTFASASGTCPIILYRGSLSAYTGTVYYRAGTSGAWTTLSVSGTGTTFPITDTTMQVAHDWNKSGDNYMTPSFEGSSVKTIDISQKAVVSGVVGNFFMYYYAYNCISLTSLAVPNTSGVTSAASDFMRNYAYNCSSLTSLAVPNTSSVTSVASGFMTNYAYNCISLTSLAVPDTSSVTSVGGTFMYSYAYNCSSLTSLGIPDTSGVTSAASGFMRNYAAYCTSLTSLGIPDTSSVTSVGSNFMLNYAYKCSSLTSLNLPSAGWFKTNNVGWNVSSGRLGILKGYVTNATDLSDWQALTVSGETLYTNYIQSSGDVILVAPISNTAIVRRRLL